ncbi:hypothetical protein [Clostridium sp. Marseille-QA1073]
MKYFYKKYTVKKVTTYQALRVDIVDKGVPRNNSFPYGGYSSYKIDNDKGIFVLQGSKVYGRENGKMAIFYEIVNNDLVKFDAWYSGGAGIYYKRPLEQFKLQSNTIETSGEYITTTVAEDGKYPNNATHNDGYWYIRQKPVITKFLIRDKNNDLYTYDGISIVLSSSQTLDDNNFIANGFDDVTIITEEQWDSAFSDKTGLKLLMWTDDMDKDEITIMYEFKNLYRPIDVLKKINDGKFDILMKEIE